MKLTKFIKKMKSPSKIKQEGMTLPELLIAATILVIAVTGILISYLRCLELNEVSQNSSLAAKNCLSDCLENTQDTSDINVSGTVNVLEASKLCCVERFVYANTQKMIASLSCPPPRLAA